MAILRTAKELKIDPITWKGAETTIAADNPGLDPKGQEFNQKVVDLLSKTGQIKSRVISLSEEKIIEITGLGKRKLSKTVPSRPEETKKWVQQKDKGLAEASKIPETEFISPLNLIGPRLPTAEDALAGTAGILASQGSPMSKAERDRFLAIKKAQADAASAAKVKADKEAQREADRVALEQLRLQKESELIQYKSDYFASPQVGIHIGDRWVGNAITIEFTENVSKSPLYGYASTHFDAVAKGNVIVQGQFSIAYTGENYLPAILDRYRRGEGVADSVPFLLQDPIERAKKLFWNLENVDEPVNTRPLTYGYSGGKTGMVGDGFNIRVFYGSQNFLLDSFEGSAGNLKFSGPVQTITNVHLTSRSFIIQPTGDPIGESYTFFARSITTGVRRQSINPNKVLRSRQGQINVATVTGTTPTGLRNEPNNGPV